MATVTESPAVIWENVEELLRQLGGIAAKRVRMRPVPGTATEADLLAVNERKLGVCELVDRMLVEKGMGYNESDLTVILIRHLSNFISARNLGILTGEAGMMRLAPGLVRVPDIAFASWGRIPNRRRSKMPIAGFAPDLAIEVLSRSNTKAEMARKRREYFEAGVRIVWQVDPKKRTVAVYDAPERSTLLDASATLDGGEVLPGFELRLADLFGELDRPGG